jgi:uncharacterized membrane protein YedE/YeeE
MQALSALLGGAAPPAELARRAHTDAVARPQALVVTLAGLLLAAGAAYLSDAVDSRQAALYLVGGALGIALYHALFGFTSDFRRFIADGRGAGLRAQMLMLAVASAIFAPLLAGGHAFGQPLGGALAPVGVSVIAGSFLFGVGMQLAGGCGSGTLFTVGGGSTRMVLTLVGFITGSVIGTAHVPWWLAAPKLAPISVFRELGWVGGLATQLAFIGAIVLVTAYVERRRHGSIERPVRAAGLGDALRRLLLGRWPLFWGALALALLNVATLLLAGRPWGITWGFTLWGAKLFDAAGIDMSAWTYWQYPAAARALERSVILDTTSVMNFGIIIGALLAAGLAGKFAPSLRMPPRSALAAIVGGLLLGYGARLAFGCNIGAFFSGVASGSVHGWVWLAFGLLGTFAGIYVRPLFGLAVERVARPGPLRGGP